MGILIDDMKMPTSCADCFFAIKDKITTWCDDEDCDYKVKLAYNCHFKPDEIEDGWVGFDIADKKRQEWCPLNEVKHGHWVGEIDLSFLFNEEKFYEALDKRLNYLTDHTSDEYFEYFAPFTCSVCEAKSYNTKPYCPNCGARMDEEADKC